MSLLPQEWAEAAQVFIDSVEHVMLTTRKMSEDGRFRIESFVHGLVLREKPFMLMSPEGIDRAVWLVFSDEGIRDFVLTLGFTFFARWGATRDRYAQLVESLAFAVSGDPHVLSSRFPSDVRPAMPPAILAVMPQEADVYTHLLENKWAATLLMMQLCVEVPDPPKQGKVATSPARRP